jgi:DNA invertase Pin-like site-specific DNA recombinase/transposase-like protein
MSENSGQKKRGVIYARVSTEEQRKKGFSLDSQVRILGELMKRDGVEEVHPPITEAESGRDFEREGIEELLRLAQEGSIDYVYVYQLDRLGRHIVETPSLMWKLHEFGVTVRTPRREHELDQPFEYLLTVMESYRGDEESRLIGERTQRGKREKFMQRKKWFGPVPFGYRLDGDWIEKNPELEPIVAEIFSTYIKIREVKKTTEEINKKFKLRLSGCQIRRILSNPIYIGRPKYGKQEVHDPELAIIPEQHFTAAQALLEGKASKRRAKRARKPNSILDEWARKFGIDYVARVLEELKPLCPKCTKVEVRNGGEVFVGPKMVGNGSKIVEGVRLPRFRCPLCGHQRTIPLGSQLEYFQGGNLLICPNPKCRAVDNFAVRRLLDSSWEYTCRDCGLSFRTNVTPEKPKRELPNPEQRKLNKAGNITLCQRQHKRKIARCIEPKIDPAQSLDKFLFQTQHEQN